MFFLGLKFFSATIVALAGYGVSTQYMGTKSDQEMYLPIGQMVDIGGYRLHMVDSATCDLMQLDDAVPVVQNSKFTVIMDAGFACNCLDWSLVQPEIAQFARVITYDRAGYAWSDPSPLHRTSLNIVQELHTMLEHAGVAGPYILVGHSFGGCNMQMYAALYPDEVAGLVLVDSVHEDQVQVLHPPASKYFQLLTGAVYLGAFRLLAKVPVVCDIMQQQIVKFPQRVQDIYYSQSLTNKFVDTLQAEAYFAPEDCRQLKELAPMLHDVPLTVISAGKPFMSYEKGQPFYTVEQIDSMNQQWPILQRNLAKKSSHSRHLIAQDSGHMIPVDQPEIVVQAVFDMIVLLESK